MAGHEYENYKHKEILRQKAQVMLTKVAFLSFYHDQSNNF